MNSELILLDGATGTELNRRGVDTGLPMWSANVLTNDTGLNVLRQIHLDYLNAGEDPDRQHLSHSSPCAGWQRVRSARIDQARGGDRPGGYR